MKSVIASCAAVALVAASVAGAQAGPPPAPGTMIEQAPLAPNLGLADASQAIAIVYGSTDGVTGRGAVPVSGAIFLPKGKAPRGGWPIVAWAHGTVGIGDGCAPSRNPRSMRDATYLNGWLREGYAVVATDYQGLGTPGPHPYLNTRAQAYSVLDAVRAALAAKLGLANKVIVVGQSQGASAAFATAGEAGRYAPTVRVLGTVATGIPYLNGTLATPTDTGTVDRTIAYPIYIAAAAQAIDPAQRADAVFTSKAMTLVGEAEQRCVGDMMKAVVDAGLTRRNAMTGDFAATFAPYLRGTAYRSLHVPTPVFVGTGSTDADVPAVMQDALVRDACAKGTKIVHHTYAGLDHSGALNPRFADSRLFARALVSGKQVATNCATAK